MKKNINLRNKTDKAELPGLGCNLIKYGTILRQYDNFLMDLYFEPGKNTTQFFLSIIRSLQEIPKIIPS